MQVSRRRRSGSELTRLARAVSSLFANGEQGVWYDPSDLSTLFQDSAGTTPVTAVEQPVGLMLDKSKGLVLGPELVTNGDFSVDANWTKGTTWAIASGKATANGGANFLQQSGFSWAVGKVYQVNYTLSDVTAGYVEARLSTGAKGKQRSTNGTFTETLAVTAIADTILNIIPTGFVGSIDNISVRELPGNHAYQATAAKRPTLSARYNLLTYTEQFDNAAWISSPTGASTFQGTGSQAVVTANYGVAPDGTQSADRIVLALNGGTTFSDRSGIYQAFTFSAASCAYSLYIKSLNAVPVSTIAAALVITFTVTSTSVVDVGEGWYKVTWTGSSAGGAGSLRVQTSGSGGVDVADMLVWGASFVPADLAHLPYQRVAAATDYDTVGFKPYLKCDGVDDALQTNSIDFTATDEMTVWAGVRKASDAALGIVTELSANASTNPGAFRILAPASAAADYGFFSTGTVSPGTTVSNSVYAAPITNVATGIGKISGDVATLRVNGVQAAANANDQGTGNYGNYPLYIGARAASSNYFNGMLSSLIVRGKTSTTAEIEATENYVNSKTDAYDSPAGQESLTLDFTTQTYTVRRV